MLQLNINEKNIDLVEDEELGLDRDRSGEIRTLMINGLEEPEKEIIDGKECEVLTGEFVCHSDIPETSPNNNDQHFSVFGESDEKYCYFVSIQRIEK